MMRFLGSDAVLLVADLLLTIVVLKATLLAATVVALRTFVRRAGPGVQDGLWTATFAALLALPALAFVVPTAELQLLGFPRLLWTLDADSLVRLIAREGEEGASGAAPAGLRLASWLFALWAVGVGLHAVRFAHAVRHARVLARRAARPDTRLALALARAARQAGVRRTVRLVLTQEPGAPFTFGCRRPVLVLPAAAATWTDARLRAVFAHELAHIGRNDYARLLLAELVCTLFWINPLVPILRRFARLDQDKACDAAAVHAGMPSVEYAHHLLDLARTARAPSSAAALPLLPRRSALRARVAAVLDPSRFATATGPARTAFAAFTLLILTLGLASANLWICDAAPAAAVVTATTD